MKRPYKPFGALEGMVRYKFSKRVSSPPVSPSRAGANFESDPVLNT